MRKFKGIMAVALPIVLVILILAMYSISDSIFSASGAASSYNPNSCEYDILLRLRMCSFWGYTIEEVEMNINGNPIAPHSTLIHHYTPERMQAPTSPLFPDPKEGVEAVGYTNAWLSPDKYEWIGLRVSGVHDIKDDDVVELKVSYRFLWLHRQQVLSIR